MQISWPTGSENEQGNHKRSEYTRLGFIESVHKCNSAHALKQILEQYCIFHTCTNQKQIIGLKRPRSEREYEGRLESFKTDAVSSKLRDHVLNPYYQSLMKICQFFFYLSRLLFRTSPSRTRRMSILRSFNGGVHADNFVSRFSNMHIFVHKLYEPSDISIND